MLVWNFFLQYPEQYADAFAPPFLQDALDENTVHYGTLAKRILAACDNSETLELVYSAIENVVKDMAMRRDGSCKLSYAGLTFTFPKASMYGQGVDLSTTIDFDNRGKSRIVQRSFNIKEMRLVVLIGVNDNERQTKQPLVVDLQLILGADVNDEVSTLFTELFGVERKLAQVCILRLHVCGCSFLIDCKIIEDTNFETLEALATFTAKLEFEVLSRIPSCKQFSLGIEKPVAVVHADASGVTVFRTLPVEPQATNDLSTAPIPTGDTPPSQLQIIRPYV